MRARRTLNYREMHVLDRLSARHLLISHHATFLLFKWRATSYAMTFVRREGMWCELRHPCLRQWTPDRRIRDLSVRSICLEEEGAD